MLEGTEGGDRNPDLGIIRAEDGCVPEVSLRELRASAGCLKLISLQGRIISASAHGLSDMELPDHGEIAGRMWWTLWPESQRQKVRSAFDLAALGEATEFIAVRPSASGELRHWRVAMKPVIGLSGRIDKLLVTSAPVEPLD